MLAWERLVLTVRVLFENWVGGLLLLTKCSYDLGEDLEDVEEGTQMLFGIIKYLSLNDPSKTATSLCVFVSGKSPLTSWIMKDLTTGTETLGVTVLVSAPCAATCSTTSIQRNGAF